MLCAKCNYDNPADALLCMKCGRKVENRCSSCNTVNPADANFCQKCGEFWEQSHRPHRPLLPPLRKLHASKSLMSSVPFLSANDRLWSTDRSYGCPGFPVLSKYKQRLLLASLLVIPCRISFISSVLSQIPMV